MAYSRAIRTNGFFVHSPGCFHSFCTPDSDCITTHPIRVDRFPANVRRNNRHVVRGRSAGVVLKCFDPSFLRGYFPFYQRMFRPRGFVPSVRFIRFPIVII